MNTKYKILILLFLISIPFLKDTVEIIPYTNGLLNRATEIENLVTGTLAKRVNPQIKYEGFVTGSGWETAVLIP